MTDLVTELALAWLVLWLQVYAHAERNQHDPFWFGFLHPFGPSFRR